MGGDITGGFTTTDIRDYISIHTSVWEVTMQIWFAQGLAQERFQSTPPYGRWQCRFDLHKDLHKKDFNPHLRMGGDIHHQQSKLCKQYSFQSTPPYGRWPQFLGVCLKFTRKICEKLINFIKYKTFLARAYRRFMFDSGYLNY